MAEAMPIAQKKRQRTFNVFMGRASNENKMSDGGRARVSLGVKVSKSSQKWSVQRSAVRSSAWLGLWICIISGLSVKLSLTTANEERRTSDDAERVTRNCSADVNWTRPKDATVDERCAMPRSEKSAVATNYAEHNEKCGKPRERLKTCSALVQGYKDEYRGACQDD